jgi:hypothetical protein
MLQPDLMYAYTKARQQSLLEEAEAHRLYQQTESYRSNFIQQLGRFLVATGQRLIVQAQPQPVTPAFGKK